MPELPVVPEEQRRVPDEAGSEQASSAAAAGELGHPAGRQLRGWGDALAGMRFARVTSEGVLVIGPSP